MKFSNIKNDIVEFNIDGKKIKPGEKINNEDIDMDNSDLLVRLVCNDGGIVEVDATLFGDITEPAISIDILEDSKQAIAYKKQFEDTDKKQLVLMLVKIFNS